MSSRLIDCDYTTGNFNRLLNHSSDEQSLNKGFSYNCDVWRCSNQFNKIQSFRRHLKCYQWFFERHVQRYNTGVASEELDNLTENKENQNEIPTLKDDYTRHCRRYWISFLNLSFTNFDHEKLIANFLSELREIYWTKTEASCFVSDKVIHIFYLETKSGTNFSRIHQYSQKCPKLCRGPRDRGSSYFWKSI